MSAKFVSQPVPEGHKQCSGCLAAKPVAAFYVDRTRPDGRTGRCVDCRRAQAASQRRIMAELDAVYERLNGIGVGQHN